MISNKAADDIKRLTPEQLSQADAVRKLLNRKMSKSKLGDQSLINNYFMNPYNQDDIPIFTLYTADFMMRDPVVSFGMGIRNGVITQGEVEVFGDDEREVALASEIWNNLWYKYGKIFRQAKRYGRQPGQVTFERVESGDFKGLYLPEECRGIHPRGARLLTANGRPAAVRQSLGGKPIPMPGSFWITYDMQFNNWYGRSLLHNSYGPFWEKWVPRGAKDCKRKRVYKDGYDGGVHWVKDELIPMPDGTFVSARDSVEAMEEQRTSGGAMIRQREYDDNNNLVTEYTPPHDNGTGEIIMQNYEDVQDEIWLGQGIPAEIARTAERGSFSGRSIPLLMLLGSCDDELQEIVSCVDRDIIRRTVHLNQGRKPSYQMKAKSLISTMTDDMATGDGDFNRGFNSDQGPIQFEDSDAAVRSTISPTGVKIESRSSVQMQDDWLGILKKKRPSN